MLEPFEDEADFWEFLKSAFFMILKMDIVIIIAVVVLVLVAIIIGIIKEYKFSERTK